MKKKAKKKALKATKRTVKKVKKRVAKKAKRKAVKSKKKSVKTVKQTASMKVIASGASLEEIGVVTHYFPHVEAAVVKMTNGTLNIGDEIILKGHTTDFKEKVDSIQLDHASINSASIGQEIGLKVKSKVREHDAVYKIVS
ncbi:MAG: hypothetical protein ABH815_02560 [Candidatus Omnitrophota bacterium]